MPRRPEPTTKRPKLPTLRSLAPKTIYCEYCGRQNGEDEPLCKSCGAPLPVYRKPQIGHYHNL